VLAPLVSMTASNSTRTSVLKHAKPLNLEADLALIGGLRCYPQLNYQRRGPRLCPRGIGSPEEHNRPSGL
jgi:hypothetical protein